MKYGKQNKGGQSRALRAIITAGLSLSMALGSVPMPAIAESLDDSPTTIQVQETDPQIDLGEEFTSSEDLADGTATEDPEASESDAASNTEADIVEQLDSESTDAITPQAAVADEDYSQVENDLIVEEAQPTEETPAENDLIVEEAQPAKSSATTSSKNANNLAKQAVVDSIAFNCWNTYTHKARSVDQLKITVRQSGLLKVTCTSYFQNAFFKLYDADGVNVYSRGGTVSGTEESPGTNAFDCWLNTGTYTLKVDAGHDYWYGFSRTDDNGRYRVKVELTAKESDAEPNDNFDSSQTLAAGKQYRGLLRMNPSSWDGDADYYRISVPSGTRSKFFLSWTDGESWIQVFDSNYTAVDCAASKDSGGVAWWGEYDLPAGTAYIRIHGGRDKNTGPYTLKWQALNLNLAKATIKLSKTSYTYNGQIRNPSVKVRINGETLIEGTDYTVSYSRGCKKKGTYKVTVKGMGKYSGKQSKKFTIVAANVGKAKVTKVSKKKYTGRAIKPNPKVKMNGRTLKRGSDYTITYKNNKRRGTATIIIKGKGNYTGIKKVTFRIV